MNIFVNTLGIFTALIMGIFLGSKTNAKTAIIETLKKTGDKLKSHKAIIISPSKIFKRNLLNKELTQEL